jgi:hypothetical protein
MDTALRKACHEISRNIAVQQAQQYCRLLAMTILIVLLALTVGTARSAGIASSGAADPLQEVRGPCDPRLDRPDYVGGADVTGHPVAPADLADARHPVPDEILVPLGHGCARAGQVRALRSVWMERPSSRS